MTWRRLLTGVLSWVFGLATTVALVSMWGRAVAEDPSAVIDAARPLATATVVVERFEDLVAEAMSATFGMDPGVSRQVVDGAFQQVDADEILAGLLADMVRAAASTDRTVIDVGDRLLPLAENISERVTASGYPVDTEAVVNVLRGLQPVVVEGTGRIGPSSPTARGFSTATLVGLVLMAGSGAGLVAMSEQKVTTARSLLARIAVSAFTFAVLLRVGSWISDPAGGRAPVRRAVSVLLAQKTWVPMAVGSITLAASTAWGWARRNRRRPTGRPEDVEHVAEPVGTA